MPDAEASRTASGPVLVETPPKAKPKPKLGEDPLETERVLQELQNRPAFQPLNVRREFERCSAWCEAHGKIPSKQRLVNWLLRAEAPLLPPARASPGVASDRLPPEQPPLR